MQHEVPALVITSSLPWVPTALGVVRSLGRAGVPVICLQEGPGNATALSRYVLRTYTCPSQDEEGIAEGVLAAAEAAGGRLAVFASSDRQALVLAKHSDSLPPSLLWHRSSLEAARRFADKEEAAKLTEELGIRSPATAILRSRDELTEALDRLAAPWIAKPLGHSIVREGHLSEPKAHEVLKAKAVVFQTSEQASTVLGPVLDTGEPVVMQEYVPGGDDQVYQAHLLMGTAAEVSVFVGRKLRQHPRQLGTGCYMVSVPDWRADDGLSRMVAGSKAFAEASGIRGLCHCEWKRHAENGEFYFIEGNPRVCLWNVLGSVCGLNQPLAAYLDLVYEGSVPHNGDAREKRYYVDDISDPRSYRAEKKGLWWLHYLRALGKPRERAFLVADDIMPGVVTIWRNLIQTAWRRSRKMIVGQRPR